MGSGLPASDDPRSRSLRQAAILASGLMLLRGDPVLQERIHILMERTGASMAGVTVIDHDTCWLPICHSASLESISVSESLCATVVSQNKLSLIADLTTDPVLGTHPAVVGPMKVRAYAGVPLKGILGSAIGSVFVADTKARSDFDDRVIALLHVEAEYIQDEIKLERRRYRTRHTVVPPMMELIREAMRAGDDELVTMLDKILQSVDPAAGR